MYLNVKTDRSCLLPTILYIVEVLSGLKENKKNNDY